MHWTAPWEKTMHYSTARLAMIALVAQALTLGVWTTPAAALEELWDIEAVDATGEGTHPGIASTDPVTFQGIVLNAPGDMLDTTWQWQLYVQALPGNPAPFNQGGIACYANGWYGGTWPRYDTDFAPGDVVEITGLLGFYNGKTNLNERHNPMNLFTIATLGAGALPDPQVVPSIAEAILFDLTRATGGERYQGQWCQLRGASLTDPAAGWGNGTLVPITDGSGATLPMLCGSLGNFDTASPPPGTFNLTAIFDQEDDNGDGDYHDGYRMWPLAFDATHFQIWGDTDLNMVVDETDRQTVLASMAAGLANPTWADGDFNADGIVDQTDLDALAVNLPEPATLALLGLGWTAAMLRRRTKRRASA